MREPAERGCEEKPHAEGSNIRGAELVLFVVSSAVMYCMSERGHVG